jgi:hypothetical protein
MFSLNSKSKPGSFLVPKYTVGMTKSPGMKIAMDHAQNNLTFYSLTPPLVCLKATVKPSFIRIGFLIKMMW